MNAGATGAGGVRFFVIVVIIVILACVIAYY